MINRRKEPLLPPGQPPNNVLQSYQPGNDFADWIPYGGYGTDGGDEQVNLRELWTKIFKHKWLIFSVVTIVTTVVTIAAYGIKPWYKATTVIEVGKENSINLKPGEAGFSDDADPFYLVNINTKKLALSSYELFEAVVIDQRLDQNPQVVEAVQKKPFFAFFKSDERAAESNSNQATVKDKNQKAKNERRTNNSANNQPSEGARLAPYVDFLRGNTDIEHVVDTRALQITFTGDDPELAASITNSIAKIFMERNFSNQTERFNNSADWLDTSTRQLKAKAEAAETALADYTRQKQIYSTDLNEDNTKKPTLTTTKLAQLHDQYIRAQTDRMLKQSLYAQLQQGRISELPEVFSDPKIVEAQKQLNQLVTQAAELKARFGPENPKIIEIQNQVTALTAQIESNRNQLESKLKADYERSVQDEQALAAALEKSKAEAVNENQAAIKLNILQQDVQTARTLYTDFLQKTNQAKAQVADQNNNIKVIQAAQIPLNPAGPKRPILIALGFLMSLGAGIAFAFLIEYLDHTVKSIEDVETYAQLPVLGLIPKSSSIHAPNANGWLSKRKNQSLSLVEGERETNQTQLSIMQSLENHSLIGEAYRTLRTAILMSAAGSPPKTILVTSGAAGEGKTTTAINTAISLTQLGTKVLLIDGDLRRPTIHRRLNITPDKGLSAYLSSNSEIDEFIHPIDIPNLALLPCGQIPPNPAELISSNKMREMLKELSGKYDHIVIDSPPLASVTDSIILSGLADGTIIVVNSGKTVRELLQRCRQELLNVRSKILGVVLNNVTLEPENYYRYYDNAA